MRDHFYIFKKMSVMGLMIVRGFLLMEIYSGSRLLIRSIYANQPCLRDSGMKVYYFYSQEIIVFPGADLIYLLGYGHE